MQVGEQRDDLLLVAHVEVRERLVEQQQIGLGRRAPARSRRAAAGRPTARTGGGPACSSASTLAKCFVDARALLVARAPQSPPTAVMPERHEVAAPDRRHRRSRCSSAARSRPEGFPVVGVDPSTVTSPSAGLRRPSRIWSSVVLPDPFGPMTITTAPRGHAEGALRPHSAAASHDTARRRARPRRSSSHLTAFAEPVSWLDLPRDERGVGRRGLGDLDDRHAGGLGRRPQLRRHRALGLRVEHEDVDRAVVSADSKSRMSPGDGSDSFAAARAKPLGVLSTRPSACAM